MVVMNQIAPHFRAIAARRHAIQGELSHLKSQIEALEVERGELEVAARVLHRLGLLAEEAGPELPLPATVTINETRPTVPDMIRASVADIVSLGLDGATNQMVLAETTRRWGVSDPNVVRPTIWRMVKDGRLIRNGDLYTLPNMPDGFPIGEYPTNQVPLNCESPSDIEMAIQ